MSEIAIITDSLASIPSELVQEYGIAIVPQSFTMEGKTYRDLVDMPAEKFWPLWKRSRSFSTNAVIPGEFVKAYQEAARKTDTILCIVASKAMSGTFQSAIQAREVVKSINPDLKIEIMDGKFATGALGLIVIEAARAAQAGRSLTDIARGVEEMIGKVKSICGMDTLKYLIRSGRSPIKVYTRELRGVRPLIGMVTTSGLVDSLGSIKGKQPCFKRLLEMVGEYSDIRRPLHAIVQYTDKVEDGKKLLRMVKAKYNCAEIYLTTTSQNSSGHSGPSNSISFYS